MVKHMNFYSILMRKYEQWAEKMREAENTRINHTTTWVDMK